MNIKNILSLTLIFACTMMSCTEDVFVNRPKESLVIEVSADGDKTRTAYSGFSTSFENGDVIGVYCLNGNNAVVQNIPFTFDESKWNAGSNVAYSDSYTYYAYYPYTADAYPLSLSGNSVDEKFSTFVADEENKFHFADQSTKSNYTKSDLMIAESSKSAENTVVFHMKHKKALAVFEGEGALEAEFSGNIPYTMNDKRYFLMKPSTSTDFNDGNDSYSLTSISGKYIKKSIDKKTITGDYLMFTAETEGTFTLTIPAEVGADLLSSVSYSVNGGNWVTTENSSSEIVITTPTIAAGGKVMWKATGSALATNSASSIFSSTEKFSLSGNIMSMLHGDNYDGKTTLNNNYAFKNIFANSKVTSAKTFKLPATTLTISCYNGMFASCTSLTSAPSLPANTLADYCYNSMFNGCTSLTSAPALPATTLALFCYESMFEGCTSLLYEPRLPATTLADHCYESMFSGCTSLTSAPALPATTLASFCYKSMFEGCTSLLYEPRLPATTLDMYCYNGMFASCTSLTSAPSLPATNLKYSCYQDMFKGCTSLTSAPSLPANTLADYCYRGMFESCTSLTLAPSLPATTLKESCYSGMFARCTSLTSAPSLPATKLVTRCYSSMFLSCENLISAPLLPATTLAEECYYSMFHDCTSLTSAPSLPATTLAEECYKNMFVWDSSLTSAPELPATTLVKGCYNWMFAWCSKLSYIKAMFTTTPSSIFTDYWVVGVNKTGTFVKNSAATWNVTGKDGIPEGWTVQTASN